MNKNIDYTALGKRIKEKRIEKGLRRNSSANCASFLRHTSVTLSVEQEYFPLMFFSAFLRHLTQVLMACI